MKTVHDVSLTILVVGLHLLGAYVIMVIGHINYLRRERKKISK